MQEPIERAAWLDLHKLRLFATVAEYEHYSRAAAALGIRQPALTVHVRDLERHFGMPLFERVGRNVRLTAAGRVVQGYARRILVLVRELDEEVADLRGVRAGTLQLGASTTIGDYLLPDLLGTFRERYPGVTVTVAIANTSQIAERVRRGELHLGLVGEPLTDDDLVSEPYRNDEIVLIVPPKHRWVGQTIAPRALADMPLIMRERGSATRDVTLAALAAQGVQPPIALELGGTEAVKGAVAAGLGVAFVSSCAVTLELGVGWLARVQIEGLVIRRQFQVARRRGRRLSAAETAFLALLRAAPIGNE